MQKEQIAHFTFSNTRAICYFSECENWKQGLAIYITPFGFTFFYKKESDENNSLLLLLKKRVKRVIHSFKKPKERFSLFCQKTSDSHKKSKSEFPNLSQSLRSLSISSSAENSGKDALSNFYILYIYNIYPCHAYRKDTVLYFPYNLLYSTYKKLNIYLYALHAFH